MGGTALNLLRVVERTTTDVDVIACAKQGADGTVRLTSARPFPEAMSRAIRTVAVISGSTRSG